MTKILIKRNDKIFLKGLAPLNPARSARSNLTGFTLIELLVVISIIGFLAVSSMVVLNAARKGARDATRVANIASVKRVLAMYLNDSQTGYPSSAGECLRASAGVGQILLTAKVSLVMPVDPLWPTTVPSNVTAGFAVSPSANFCYYYYSNASNTFKISYYLESNSKAGNIGINTTTQ